MGQPRRSDFDDWFYSRFSAVSTVATRIVGDRAGGEDVAAEAFTRALTRWDKVRGLPERDAWVTRVAVNLAIDQLRRRKPVGALPEPVADSASQVERRPLIVAALRRLSRQQREVVALRYLADFSEAEVVAALGIAPGTVKTHLRRGLASLRADRELAFEEGNQKHVVTDQP